MPQMVGSELRLEAIRGMSEGCSHHAGISNHDVEGTAISNQRIGASTHILERREIKLHQREAATIRGIGTHLRSYPFRLREIACGADHLCAVSSKHSRSFHAQTRPTRR